MILVSVEYDPYLIQQEDIQVIHDFLESDVARVFQVEQDHVDLRFEPFGPDDEYSKPLFITIECDGKAALSSVSIDSSRAATLMAAYLEHVRNLLPTQTNANSLRVWVKHTVGSFAETE